MNDLADKIEAAEGPDRELDKRIVLALYPEAIVDFYCQGDDEPVVFHAEPLVRQKGELPTYTASLDAAMTLVPEGMKWSVSTFRPKRATAQVSNRCRIAATPALALCAAALRARKENSDVG